MDDKTPIELQLIFFLDKLLQESVHMWPEWLRGVYPYDNNDNSSIEFLVKDENRVERSLLVSSLSFHDVK